MDAPDAPEPAAHGAGDAWIGATPELGEPFVVHRVEKGVEDTGDVEAWAPAGTPTAPHPRLLEQRPQVRLTHRGREVEPFSIVDGESRRLYNDLRYPWGLVCRVQFSAGAGSGVIVGPRHVLTASHVVDWATCRGSVKVHAFDDSWQAFTRVEAVWSFTEIVGGPDDQTIDEDYAVLVTDQRIGDRFGYMGAKRYDSGWDDKAYWHNIGYAGDLGTMGRPLWQSPFALDEDEWDLGSGRAMQTTGDFMRGQSGSPVFAFWSGLPYVVAVASAGSGADNYCSGGSDLKQLVREARAGDP